VEEAGGCCAICGYDRCVVCLTFHHVEPKEKLFDLSASTTKALATYREEAKKCVLLCANCHGEVETGMVASPPAGATFAGRQRSASAKAPPKVAVPRTSQAT
jgi:cytochrome c553